MCVMSMVMDDWQHRFPDLTPNQNSLKITLLEQEVKVIREELVELKKLLLAAKAYDDATGQPDCEIQEKVDLIKRIAEAVGLDFEDVFRSE